MLVKQSVKTLTSGLLLGNVTKSGQAVSFPFPLSKRADLSGHLSVSSIAYLIFVFSMQTSRQEQHGLYVRCGSRTMDGYEVTGNRPSTFHCGDNFSGF